MGIGIIPIPNTQKNLGISFVYEYWYGYDTQKNCALGIGMIPIPKTQKIRVLFLCMGIGYKYDTQKLGIRLRY